MDERWAVCQCRAFAEPRPIEESQLSQQGSTAVRPAATRPRVAPLWHVILLDDDDHTYDYVVEMLGKVFGHGLEKAYKMACEVDKAGRVVVDTTSLERAELKRDQIHAYGPDWRLERSAGSMSATLEPTE